MALIWDYETVLFRQTSIFIVTVRLFESLGCFLIPYIRNPFIIEKWSYVIFKAILSHGAS